MTFLVLSQAPPWIVTPLGLGEGTGGRLVWGPKLFRSYEARLGGSTRHASRWLRQARRLLAQIRSGFRLASATPQHPGAASPPPDPSPVTLPYSPRVPTITTSVAAIWPASLAASLYTSPSISALEHAVCSFRPPSVTYRLVPDDSAIMNAPRLTSASQSRRVTAANQHAPTYHRISHRANRVRAPVMWRRGAPPQWRAQRCGGEGACG